MRASIHGTSRHSLKKKESLISESNERGLEDL